MSFWHQDQFFHPCWHNMNKQWYIQTWIYSMSILWRYSTRSTGDSKPRVCCQSDNIKGNALGLNAFCPEEAEVDTLPADARNPGVTWLPRNSHWSINVGPVVLVISEQEIDLIFGLNTSVASIVSLWLTEKVGSFDVTVTNMRSLLIHEILSQTLLYGFIECMSGVDALQRIC